MVALSLLAAFGAAGHAAGRPAPEAAELRDDLSAFLLPRPGMVLTDQDGHGVGRADLADRVVVLSFTSATCPAPCFIRTLDLGAISRSLPAQDRAHVAFLSVMVDAPPGDVADLAGYARGLGIEASALRLLAVPPEDVARMMRSIAFRAAPDAPEPVPPTVFVFDRKGQAAMRYAGSPVDRRRLAGDVSTLAELAQGVGGGVRAADAL